MEAVINPKTDYFVLQTQIDIPKSKIMLLRNIIESETYYTILMNECFNEFKEKQWDSQQASIEIITQIGHMIESMIDATTSFITSDELADIVTNIFLLAYFEGITFANIAEYAYITSSQIIRLFKNSYEIMEEIRKKNGYKIRNHDSKESTKIIENKLSEMLIIIVNYAKENGIDIQKALDDMHEDSSQFLLRKITSKKGEKYGNIRYI